MSAQAKLELAGDAPVGIDDFVLEALCDGLIDRQPGTLLNFPREGPNSRRYLAEWRLVNSASNRERMDTIEQIESLTGLLTVEELGQLPRLLKRPCIGSSNGESSRPSALAGASVPIRRLQPTGRGYVSTRRSSRSLEPRYCFRLTLLPGCSSELPFPPRKRNSTGRVFIYAPGFLLFRADGKLESPKHSEMKRLV